ncbi:hypothetical protein BH24GEM3_BH24GEM3_07340 [soil metagenome]
MMRFQFDANQEYQLRAIDAVAGLFRGQPRSETRLEFAAGSGFAAVPNRLNLAEDTLLRNLLDIQEENRIAPDAALQHIEQTVELPEGTQEVRFPNFSVEMETGTGKTYVYLRTALELFRRYGMRKFIVVVPSVAVREGVLKTLEITRAHFREHFDNLPYRFYAYDSANLSQVRQFALSDTVEMLVMTIDSFNKASNVIHQNTDRLPGVEVPIQLLQAVRPVLILDEPQNMESEARVAALAALHPLFALRYSATHRNPYNVVYRLTPVEAYRQGLVKRIEVAGVEQGLDANQVFLRLEQVATQRNRVTARLTVHKRMANGTVREATVTVGAGVGCRQALREAPLLVRDRDPNRGLQPGLGGGHRAARRARRPDRRADALPRHRDQSGGLEHRTSARRQGVAEDPVRCAPLRVDATGAPDAGRARRCGLLRRGHRRRIADRGGDPERRLTRCLADGSIRQHTQEQDGGPYSLCHAAHRTCTRWLPMRRLPLFPLPVVLFPGAAMPLHIFEPRYRQMMAHCIEGDGRFGLLYHDPDRHGPFRFEGQVGCVAEILEFQPIPDGRSIVLTRGLERFRIVEEVESEALYYEARVEEYLDLEPNVPELRARRRRSFHLFRRALERLSDAPVIPPLEEDRDASFQLAQWIQIDPAWQQELLERRDELSRLEMLDNLLHRVLEPPE